MISEKNRKWWGLCALVPSLAMIFLDQSVLPVALPTIQRELGAGSIALEWTVNAYILATAVFVLAAGKVGDWIGHKQAFIFGVLLFAIASLLCGMSLNVLFLIAARTLQGIGAALIFPSSTVLLMALFPQKERGKATGINVSVSSLFLIMGPLIGGYFTEAISWRWIFWINIPLALLAIILVAVLIPISPKGEGKIDLWGFLFFVSGSSFLVAAIMQAREWGWLSMKIFTLLFVSLLSAICLLWREKKAKHPFLDLSLFKHPVFKAVNITVFSIQFILMISVFRAIFFQEGLEWSPIKTGLVTFLSSVPVLFISPVGGYLSDKFGPKLPIAIGFSFLIYSFVWIGLFVQSSLGILILGLFAFGFGIPLVFTPAYASAMGAVPPQKAGIAFGTIATLRSLGGSLGIAVIGSLIDTIEYGSFKNLLSGLSLNTTEIESLILGGEPAQKTLQTLPNSDIPRIMGDLGIARFDGFFYSHLILAFLLVIIFAFVFVLYNRKSSHHLPKAPAQGWD